MGLAYQSKGEWDRAIEFYDKAIEIYERLGDIHGAGMTYFNVGLLYLQKEDYKTAYEYAQKAYDIFVQYRSPHIKNAEGLLNKLKPFIN